MCQARGGAITPESRRMRSLKKNGKLHIAEIKRGRPKKQFSYIHTNGKAGVLATKAFSGLRNLLP